MTWSIERRRDACFRASMGGVFLRPDTVIVERPGWYQVITPTSKSANEIVFSQLGEDEADLAIENAVAAYRAHGQSTKWCVGYWTKPDDFGERLIRHGFTSWDVRGMGCESSLVLAAPNRVSVEEVTDNNMDGYIRTLLRGWSLPPEEGDVERRVLQAALGMQPRTEFCFVARLDSEMVGTAALALRGDYAYLLGTQVLESARGHGVYRALVSARLAFLQRRGIEYAVTQAREATSAPMLEHLGFETLFRSKCYLRA